MRITSVTLRNYRLHRDLHVDFDPSRTLVGGPNETGKSTMVEAVHRALFLKAKGNSEHHRSMESSVYLGHPEVELAFEAGGSTYLLKKRFGPNGTTTLAPSNSLSLSGDAAESELARLLSVETGIAGKAMTAQWAHLWVWQRQAGDDPSVHATAQQNGLLQRLQNLGGAAALQSELDARVASHFAEASDQIYTQARKPKVGSDLERAEGASALAEVELARARERVRKLDSAVADLENASRNLPAISVSLADLEAQGEETATKARELGELRQQEADHTYAANGEVARYSALDSANRQILAARKGISELEESLKPRHEAMARLENASREARDKAASTEAAHRTTTEATRAVRNRQDLASAHVSLFEKIEIHSKLSETDEKISARRRELSALEELLAKLPEVNKAKLRKIQKLQTECSIADAALQAMATGLEVLVTNKPVKAGGRPIKVGQQQILTKDTEVRIGLGIRFRIQPGGGTNLAAARRAETEARTDLQAVLDSLGLQSAEEATEANTRRDELGSRIKVAEAQLEGMGADTLSEDLQSAQSDLAAAKATVKRLEALAPDLEAPKGKTAAKASMKALEKQLVEAEDRETEAVTTRDHSAEALGSAEEALKEERAESEKQHRNLHGLTAQFDLLLSIHGDDTARSHALGECQSAKIEAQNRLRATSDAIITLQPELLESDQTRIARAIKEKASEQGELRTQIAVAKAALRSDGSEDPLAGLASAEAKAYFTGEHRSSVFRKAQAINLLNTLFQDEQRRLAKQLTQPLADKMSGYLQCIFGAGAHALVDLEKNEFRGLRLSRPGLGNAPFAFDTLSGGAREQTASAVRLAMAEVLAADYGGCLPVVFDDAFAYSDPERVNQVQRMLDLAATRGLQVIVLTCNPADYAALGAKTVALRAPSTQSNPVLESGEEFADATSPDLEDQLPDRTGVVVVTDGLRQTLVDVLAKAGGSKGNQALLKELDWDDATYRAVKDDLVATGQLVRGKGRGGSVSLPNS